MITSEAENFLLSPDHHSTAPVFPRTSDLIPLLPTLPYLLQAWYVELNRHNIEQNLGRYSNLITSLSQLLKRFSPIDESAKQQLRQKARIDAAAEGRAHVDQELQHNYYPATIQAIIKVTLESSKNTAYTVDVIDDTGRCLTNSSLACKAAETIVALFNSCAAQATPPVAQAQLVVSDASPQQKQSAWRIRISFK